MHPAAEPEVDPEADPEVDPVGGANAPGVAPVDEAEAEAAPGPDPEVDPVGGATAPDEAEAALVAMALAEVAHPVAASLVPS